MNAKIEFRLRNSSERAVGIITGSSRVMDILDNTMNFINRMQNSFEIKITEMDENDPLVDLASRVHSEV